MTVGGWVMFGAVGGLISGLSAYLFWKVLRTP